MSNIVRQDPYTPTDLQQAISVSVMVAKAGLFGVRSAEQAFVVQSLGYELGLTPMQALRGIHIVEGRPCPSADLLVALVLRSGKAEYFREIETTEECSVWETKRVGEPTRRGSFSIIEARNAGCLVTKGGNTALNWKHWPKRMLAARAKAFLARDVYPDLCFGLYTPDEIDPKQLPPETVTLTQIESPQVDPLQPMADAKTIEELREAAKALRGTVEDDVIRAAFAARKAQL